MIKEMITERNLPKLLQMKNGEAVTAENWEQRRKELVKVLGDNIYGVMPEYTGLTTWKEQEWEDIAGGKGRRRKVEITFPVVEGKEFNFSINLTCPVTATEETPGAAFVFISFGWPEFYPIEELVENDVIVAEMVYSNVALDEDDHYANLLPALYYKDGERWSDGFGKIGMWAFAASRTLDYLLSLDFVDKTRAGVVGHSRTGKTALWAGANDTRFTHVFSNGSGCMGAALTRKKGGETAPRIRELFPYWFCENHSKYAPSVEASESADLDQHFLLAAIAPRKVYVGSGSKDAWADPISEYLCCVAASPAWDIHSIAGFIHPDRLPVADDRFAEGNVGYHMRGGTHFLSRHDWVKYCDFLKNH